MSSLQTFRPRRAARRSATVATVALLIGFVTALPAAADMTIDFDFDSVIRGDEGSVTQLAERAVDAPFIGETCLMAAVAENQSSVHPGNDLIVSTGDSQAIILGVEDEANGGTSERYAITLGDTIVVQLRFGPDAISSLGFNLDFDCTTPIDQAGLVTTIVPTTLTPPPTEATTTTLPTTTSTVPVTAGLVQGCTDLGSGAASGGALVSGSDADPAGECTTTSTCQALVSIDDQGTAAPIEGGCQPTRICADGTVAIPLDGAGSTDGSGVGTGSATVDSDGCPITTTTAAPTQVVCDDGSTPLQIQGQPQPVCPEGLAVTDLPETPPAQPVVAAPAYTG